MKKLFTLFAICMMAVTSAWADETPDYLCFTAEEANSTVTFKWAFGSDVQTSTDGTSFTAYTAGTSIPLAKVGDKVYFKGTNVTTNESNHFTMTGKIAASGDVTSLTNGTGGDATLTMSCYIAMFSGCTSLTTAPALPSTTLPFSCYCEMFDGCTNLATAPELPAETMNYCCYMDMFNGCTSLTKAPELPATILDEFCYADMFCGCTSLATAPALPATTLASSCYASMFYGCTSLNSVTVSFTNWKTADDKAATNGWLDGVAATGTFTCPESLAIPETRSASDVPAGWTVAHPTGINSVDTSTRSAQAQANGKFIQDGRMVIVKDSKKYNTAGQKVK